MVLKFFPKARFKQFGFFPIDRYYINLFVKHFSEEVSFDSNSSSLEFGELKYSKYFNCNSFVWIYSSESEFDGISTISGDFLKPLKFDFKFDLIICTQVLPFVTDPKLFIQRLCEYLKPGGFILLTSPGIGVFPSLYDSTRWGDYGRYSLEMIKSFVPTGYDIVNSQFYGNFDVLRSMNDNISATFLSEKKLMHNKYHEAVIYCFIITKDIC